MRARALILTVLLLASAWYLAHAQAAEVVPPHASITDLPMAFDGWRGRDDGPFSPEVLAVLGVDEYVFRSYQRQGEPGVSLYAGFYETQRQGDSIHSPLNCLPGAGWTPVSQARTLITAFDPARRAERPLEVNRFVIQKGLDRQLVIYWYQSHGRVVASEYRGKVYTVVDAVRLNRTDAALVRVITPLGEGPGGSEAEADARVTRFVRALYPRLGTYIPG